MHTKEERHERIRRILGAGKFSTQKQLLAELKRSGLEIDQSTLSRDCAELGVRKIAGAYVLAPAAAPAAPDVLAVLAAAVRTIRVCGPHLIVIRTAVGQAQAVGVAIDQMQEASIAGTLAGDDTIFVATHSRRGQAVALRHLNQTFGEHP